MVNKNEIAEQVGAWIARTRKSQKLDQRGLASKVGISQSEISKIENGRVDAPLSVIVKIAQGMGAVVVFGEWP